MLSLVIGGARHGKSRLFLFFLSCLLLSAAESPKIAVVGGPNLLWPQIVDGYQQRYPSQAATWELGAISEPGQADLVFAYYPTAEELKGSLQLLAKRRLGFAAEFVAAEWKQPIDQETSARAAAYLDEGGVENGVRLLHYLYSLIRPDRGCRASDKGAAGRNSSSRLRRDIRRLRELPAMVADAEGWGECSAGRRHFLLQYLATRPRFGGGRRDDPAAGDPRLPAGRRVRISAGKTDSPLAGGRSFSA
jgi:hypothetical protein